METPLTPLEFGRRARKLYPERVAVIDGESRWTYAQFLDRCDRWSSVLQKLGIKSGDRVAYLSPNTHAQLESFYAVPQIGAVLVPLNYRLTADDFVYLINHSGSRMVCVDREYLATMDGIRSRLPCAEQFVALNGQGENWLDYEAMIEASPAEFTRPEIHETDLLTINYTSGTTAHPKGVMITHRNAWMNSIGTLLYVPMTCADRYLWTLPMFHANGWTFVWTVTAAGATHICLRKVEPRAVFELMASEQVTTLCAAPTVLISLANAPETLHRLAPKAIRVRLKDVIISGGENISSVEVEGVLLRHPAVEEIAIVGFPHERWGEAPHAFVVLHEGAHANERELREFARANLAHFKAPHSVTFVKELPKTATGKIQKYVLRARRPAIAPQ